MLALAAPAQARGLTRAGLAAELHARRALRPPAASCPPGAPVQILTVVNQANASPWALAKVENAIVAQSLQLRAAWGTPCVQFGPGGWNVYLRTGYRPEPDGGYTMQVGGEHYGVGYRGPDWQGQPYAIVDTGAATHAAWSYAFSHEIVEMLVDPTDADYHTWPDGSRQLLEVCDPVEQYTYTIDGVSVDDFTLSAAWSAAPSGPYDEAGHLTAPLTPGSTLGL